VRTHLAWAIVLAAAEEAGFVRTPDGHETEERKQMIRDADAARAASIRKP
jgi:hypothetical protein